MNIAVSDSHLWHDDALPILWQLRGAGNLLHLLATTPVVARPPFTMVTVAPTERWANFSSAEVFIGPEVEVAKTFIKHGRKSICVGSVTDANMYLAVVKSWAEVPTAMDFFAAMESRPKIQIEHPSSVPGFTPREEGSWEQEMTLKHASTGFPRLRRMAGQLANMLSV